MGKTCNPAVDGTHFGVDAKLLKGLENTSSHLTEDLLSRFKEINTATLKNLFYRTDLPTIAGRIHPEEYCRLIRTKPMSFDWSSYASNGDVLIKSGEYWDVNWAYGFDTHTFYKGLPDFLQNDLLKSFVHIRKQFPAQEENSGKWIKGWTTFGFDDGNEALLDTTPNRIFPVLLNDEKAQELPILMMKYIYPPWYRSDNGSGYVDYFRFLAEDIIVARGLIGDYSYDDSFLPKNATAHLFQQFWMQRKPFPSTVRTHFFSTSVVRHLWNQGMSCEIPSDVLYGEWHVDLIMNSFNEMGYGSLVVSPSGGVFRLRTDCGDDSRKIIEATYNVDKGATVLQIENDYPLELRKVSADALVLVGKVSFPVQSSKEVLTGNTRKYVYFLPQHVKKKFLSQYFEPFEPLASDNTLGSSERRFCNYYLLRKRP